MTRRCPGCESVHDDADFLGPYCLQCEKMIADVNGWISVILPGSIAHVLLAVSSPIGALTDISRIILSLLTKHGGNPYDGDAGHRQTGETGEQAAPFQAKYKLKLAH